MQLSLIGERQVRSSKFVGLKEIIRVDCDSKSLSHGGQKSIANKDFREVRSR